MDEGNLNKFGERDFDACSGQLAFGEFEELISLCDIKEDLASEEVLGLFKDPLCSNAAEYFGFFNGYYQNV